MVLYSFVCYKTGHYATLHGILRDGKPNHQSTPFVRNGVSPTPYAGKFVIIGKRDAIITFPETSTHRQQNCKHHACGTMIFPSSTSLHIKIPQKLTVFCSTLSAATPHIL